MATERFEIRDPSTNALVLDFEHETFSKDRAVNQELALDWAENNNLITRQELQALGFRLSPTSSGPEEEASTLDNIGDWTIRNASDVLGIAGGIGAGLITANPWVGLGTAALLTGVGEGVEDVYEGKDIDYMGAAKEAGVSGVTDLASLGTLRYAKPIYHALGFGAKQADTIIANQGAKNALAAGTKDSLQQTQNLLLRNSPGGRFSYTQGLTAYQTGEVGALKAFAENLTELGIFSGTVATQRALNNSRIIQEQVQELMADSIGHFGRAGTFDVGAHIHGIITAGRKALNTQYGQGLDIIQKQLGPTQVNIAPIRNALSKFRNDNAMIGKTFAGNNEPVGVLSTLDDGTLNILEGELGKLQNVKTVRAQDLISIQKSIKGKIQEAGNFGSQTFNTVVERELTQLSDALNKPIADLMEVVSPGVSQQYRALNNTYAAARGTLLPTINDAVIRAGDKESYDALGRILIGSQANKSQVKAMLKSVKQAFASIEEAGLPIEGAVHNMDQATGLIRQGYLSRLLPSIHADTFHIKDYVKLAKNLEDPTTAALAKELMGEQWGSFKSFANAMAEASNHPDSILGGLVLRGREAGAITGLASGMAQIGGAGIAGVGSLGSAAGIIFTPYVMAKIITNKKAINMLLTAQAESIAKKGAMKQTDPYAFIVSRMSQIIAELPEDDKLDIRNYIRQQESGVTMPPPSEPQVPHQLDQWGQQRKPMAMGQGPL